MGLNLALGRRAGVRFREAGALQLVSFADTQAFLDACEDSRVLVLGIEGFYLENAQARPDMDAIADFSQISDCEESVREARSFIEAVGRPEMLFDFALSEDASCANSPTTSGV